MEAKSDGLRIFVATLYSGENELDQCRAAIQRQTYRNFSHEVFSHLPDKAGHDAIYGRFASLSGRFDLMVKVDADMVLVRDDFLQSVVQAFTAHPQANLACISVHDFFSELLIQGLNVYRNSKAWATDPEENLFTDRPATEPSETLPDADRLAPAAWHCPNPSDLQCFRYGVSRALKIVHRGKRGKESPQMRGNLTRLEEVRKNFLIRRDRRLGLAVLGSELVFRGDFDVTHLDYTNQTLANALNKYKARDSAELEVLINRLRTANFGWLPTSVRRRALRYFRSGDLLDMAALGELAGYVGSAFVHRVLPDRRRQAGVERRHQSEAGRRQRMS